MGPATATVNTQCDAAGRRTQLQVVGQTAVTYGWDDANRLTSVTQGSNAVGFTYDAASRRTLATLPNLVTIDYGDENTRSVFQRRLTSAGAEVKRSGRNYHANQLTSLTYERSGATLQALAYALPACFDPFDL